MDGPGGAEARGQEGRENDLRYNTVGVKNRVVCYGDDKSTPCHEFHCGFFRPLASPRPAPGTRWRAVIIIIKQNVDGILIPVTDALAPNDLSANRGPRKASEGPGPIRADIHPPPEPYAGQRSVPGSPRAPPNKSLPHKL